MVRYVIIGLAVLSLNLSTSAQDASKLSSLYSLGKVEKCLSKSKKFRKKAPDSPVSWYYDFKCYTIKLSSSETPYTFRENLFNSLVAAQKIQELDFSGDYLEEIQPELLIILGLALVEAETLEDEGKTAKAKQLSDLVVEFKSIQSVPAIQPTINSEPVVKMDSAVEEDILINTSSDHANPNDVKDKLEELSSMLVGTPYRYGGTTPKGFDCSGFTSYVFSACAMQLPRTSSAQAKVGEKIELEKAARGDLLFFGSKNKISHVALVISRKGEPLRIAHSTSSSGVVTHSETDYDWQHYWSKRFLYARRVLD
jgi:cell wall-associated NlpC family hydrolase